MAEKEEKSSGMVKIATFIVDKRNLFLLATVILLIFSVFSSKWVNVENDLTTFLPDNSDTKQALNVMDGQFTTYGSAEVMVANVSYEEAEHLDKQIEDIDGVQSVTFDDSDQHYNNVSARYSITFDYPEDDEACLTSLDAVKTSLSDYDIYVKTDLGNSTGDIIAKEIQKIMVYVAIILVVVLTLTSQTYGEVPVLLMTFVIAMVLNSGTNFIFGTISFVSSSVTSILQLALSLDYAIILCNRFKEEHQDKPIREAVIVALSKAIPEIGSSSLTTIGGLVAMLFMQFKLGPDMAICLIKSIVYALLAVFVVMPGLLVLFGPLIDRTQHKSFLPKVPWMGKFDYHTRKIIPPVLAVLLVVAFYFSNMCPYVYGYSTVETPKLNEVQIASNMITDNFKVDNMVAVIVPGNDYETERKLLDDLEACTEVDYTMGISNIDALGGYKLGDSLTPRQFGELAGVDYEVAQLLYSAYAADQEDYGRLAGNISTYSVPLIDMFLFLSDEMDQGYVNLDEDTTKQLQDAAKQMRAAKKQLSGDTYDRMLVYLNLPTSGDETYQFLDTMREMTAKYYPEDDVYLAGESTNEYDFKKSFARDNIVVSIVSILIVLVVLLFTFYSAGMPVLLIMVIEGAIWINFSFPYFLHRNLFYLGYLIVSSIQMGANIDYAIVISSRYMELKDQYEPEKAITETMNFSFPTIITSGSIMASAGFLIGNMSSDACICGIGECLGRGTVISMVLCMFALPQVLIIGSKIIDRTSFSMPKSEHTRSMSGVSYVEGNVHGMVNGVVDGYVKARIDGDAELTFRRNGSEIPLNEDYAMQYSEGEEDDNA